MPKKYLFIFLFFFINAFIFAEEKIDPYITAAISSEQSSIVEGCVNAITGDFIFSSVDLTAFGEVPIGLNHIYTSRFRKHPFPGGFLLSEHLYVICEGNVSFKITEPSGIQLLYKQPKYSIKNIKEIKHHIEKDITLELTPQSLKGLSNVSDLSISGRLNLRNNKVVYNQKNGSLTVFSSDGSIRYYIACRGSLKDLLKTKYKNDKSDDYYREFAFLSDNFTFFFKLEKEKLANGNWTFYEYDGNDFPVKIYSTNPSKNKIYSSIDLNIRDKFTCTTSCNKTLEIQGDILKEKIERIDHWSKKHKKWAKREKERISAFIYKSKICPENPNINFHYLESDGKVITDKILPDGRILHFVHWNLQKEYRQYQQREISREYINKSSRDWFVNKIGADINSRTFQGFEKWTERALWAATAYYAGKNVVSLVKQEISFNKYFQASRSFWNQPVKTYELGSFSTNRAYSGLDVERIIKNVKNMNFKRLAEAGKVCDRGGLTKAGRALSKHGGRKGSVFSKPFGNSTQINQQGQEILEKIISDPKRIVITDGNIGFEIYLPDGRGAYFKKDGILRGFVEWKKK